MKKSTLFISFVLILILAIPVQAQTPRNPLGRVSLTFSGTTAHCSCVIYADSEDDSISATMKLWNGNQCIATWTARDTSLLSLAETATVKRGQSYTLTVDYTIEGIAKPRLSTSGTC